MTDLTDNEAALRNAVVSVARAMNSEGINRGRSGNVSARYRNDYMVDAAGGHDIRCAPYARLGSAQLAHPAVAALQDRKACLAHHGMIAIGERTADALALAIEVEGLAQMYWRVLQIGDPVLLSPEEMQAVVDKFATYGQQPR